MFSFENLKVFPLLLGSNFSIVLLGILLVLQTSQRIRRQLNRRKKVSQNPTHFSMMTSLMIGMETTLMMLKNQKKNQLKKMLRTSVKAVKVLKMNPKIILILNQPVLIGNGKILDGVVLVPLIMMMTATMKIYSILLEKGTKMKV